jgi:DNA-binding MarR family transcriptional regulator
MMEDQSKVEEILNRLINSNPIKYFQVLDDTQNGMFFILMYLSKTQEDVYASVLAREMKISRARVAKLIQKLINKNLIEVETSPLDSRIEIIKLTSSGFLKIADIKNDAIQMTKKILDQIGEEELNHYIEISSKIISVIEK